MKVTIIAALGFSPLQYIFAAIVTLVLLVVLVLFIRTLYKFFSKSKARKERERAELDYAKRVAELESEKKELERKLHKTGKVVDKETRRLEKDRAEAEQMERDLMATGIEQEAARKYASMNLAQLLALKGSKNTAVPGDFVINAVTRSVLQNSEYAFREDLDFRAPESVTKEFKIDDLKSYICTFADVEYSNNKQNEIFKIQGKSFVIFYTRSEEKFKLTLKVGNHYADKLRVVFPKTITKAKFPSGLFWYSIDNEVECSFELAKLLVEVSYNIAKAGY